MQGDIIATGLDFPEGPVWADGALYLTEINGGTIARWTEKDGVERIATTGGGPNGATLAPDGSLYVTQNGGMAPANRAQAGIQRVTLDGAVTMAFTAVGGFDLDGPNDLTFAADGRLYFTDPHGGADPARNDKPGRLFAVDITTGEGELVLDVGPVFPNGIAFAADGTLLWTESFSRRVMQLVDGRPEVVIELPERHMPDGLCIGEDGTLYVASTFAHCVSVIQNGAIIDKYMCGDGMPTNCCFGGTDLYITESRRGTIWRFALGVTGLALH